MSQLPDAFQGHDLTGWTLVGNAYVARFTNHGYTIELSSHINGTDWMMGDEDGTVVVGTIPECLFQAEVTASRRGGWAPAPIGYVPGPT